MTLPWLNSSQSQYLPSLIPGANCDPISFQACFSILMKLCAPDSHITPFHHHLHKATLDLCSLGNIEDVHEVLQMAPTLHIFLSLTLPASPNMTRISEQTCWRVKQKEWERRSDRIDLAPLDPILTPLKWQTLSFGVERKWEPHNLPVPWQIWVKVKWEVRARDKVPYKFPNSRAWASSLEETQEDSKAHRQILPSVTRLGQPYRGNGNVRVCRPWDMERRAAEHAAITSFQGIHVAGMQNHHFLTSLLGKE